MKNTILILAILFSSTVKCQDSNILTETEYDNIKINGKTLKRIKETNGLISGIQSLYGIPTRKKIDPDGEAIDFYYIGFSIAFSSYTSDTRELQLVHFDITSNQANLTVKGATVTIGDNISKLGSTVKNTRTDGKKSVIYQDCWGCNNYISIVYTPSTGVITEIYYIEMT